MRADKQPEASTSQSDTPSRPKAKERSRRAAGPSLSNGRASAATVAAESYRLTQLQQVGDVLFESLSTLFRGFVAQQQISNSQSNSLVRRDLFAECLVRPPGTVKQGFDCSHVCFDCSHVNTRAQSWSSNFDTSLICFSTCQGRVTHASRTWATQCTFWLDIGTRCAFSGASERILTRSQPHFWRMSKRMGDLAS